MKKILFCVMFFPIALQAQVGINTNNPKATLEVKKNSLIPVTQAQGVLFPKFTTAERLAFSETTEEGTIIYNTEKRCLEMYLGVISGVHQWACLPDVASAKSQSVTVTAVGFEGAYVGGVSFTTANRVKFRLENNSFSNISSSFADAVSIKNGTSSLTISNCQWQKLNGSTLIGSVASCTSGNPIALNSGESAVLSYTISGTPEAGTLQASFSKLGAQADQQTQVGLGSATITSPKAEYVASLEYNGFTYQGKIDNVTNKLVVKIPYTNGSGSYNAVTSAPVTTASGQGNDTNTLTLNISAGNFGVTGSLDATITVGGGDQEYLVKMLAPGEEYIIATIPYTLNDKPYNIVLKGIGGIPDRCYSKTTFDCVGYGSATEKEHQFIYIPVEGPDGRTWLNNNLGAEYARVDSPWFNPTHQAGALDYTKTTTAEAPSTLTADHIKKDWRAYGSLFQWQRKPDGHELITWTSDTNGTPKYTNTNSLSNSWTTPNHSLFIIGNGLNNYSWVDSALNNASTNKDLWQANGSNNPCPVGYHVPTNAEQEALHNAILGYSTGTSNTNSNKMWNERSLHLPASGHRYAYNAELNSQSNYGRLWSSDQSNSGYSWNLWFGIGSSSVSDSSNRTNGFSVRCIKD
ncbi:FISUMP domain-containing protein [Riemerella anatipestifer]|uniref:FISUMP domain-containing protein n=1 Tax=Riemerella anatipestifer TaxID=34085 RepID=UPI0013752DDF|nr:FISUMP domain-containing protein [Riemerella anatipestifer]MDY3363965.1 FISUMP domain-containing protein [Riemerella anatipestifer]